MPPRLEVKFGPPSIRVSEKATPKKFFRPTSKYLERTPEDIQEILRKAGEPGLFVSEQFSGYLKKAQRFLTDWNDILKESKRKGLISEEEYWQVMDTLSLIVPENRPTKRK